MTDDILHDIIVHTDILRNWTQTLSVIHDGVSINISSAANGNLSIILSYDFLVTLGTGSTAFNSKDWHN